jgi:hypothetical protein
MARVAWRGEHRYIPIRVALADLPQLMDELLTGALAAAPDLVLTAPAEADVVVLGTDAPAFLAAHPAAKVLQVDLGSGEGHVYELRRTATGPLTPATIPDVIRGVVA